MASFFFLPPFAASLAAFSAAFAASLAAFSAAFSASAAAFASAASRSRSSRASRLRAVRSALRSDRSNAATPAATSASGHASTRAHAAACSSPRRLSTTCNQFSPTSTQKSRDATANSTRVSESRAAATIAPANAHVIVRVIDRTRVESPHIARRKATTASASDPATYPKLRGPASLRLSRAAIAFASTPRRRLAPSVQAPAASVKDSGFLTYSNFRTPEVGIGIPRWPGCPRVHAATLFKSPEPEDPSTSTRLKFSKSASFAASAASDAATARSHRRAMSSSYLPLGAPRRNGRYRACPTPKRANTAVCSNAVSGASAMACASAANPKPPRPSRGGSGASLGRSAAVASTRDSPTSNVSSRAATCAHVNARSRRACSNASRRSRGVRRRDPTSRDVFANAASSKRTQALASPSTPSAAKSNRSTPRFGSASGHPIATGSSFTASPSRVRFTMFCRPVCDERIFVSSAEPPTSFKCPWSASKIEPATPLCAGSTRSKTCLPSGLVVSKARKVPGAACANSDWSTGTAFSPFLPPFFAPPFFPLAPPFFPFFGFLPPPSARNRRSPSARAAEAASCVRAPTSDTDFKDDPGSVETLCSPPCRERREASSARSNDAHSSAPISLPSR